MPSSPKDDGRDPSDKPKPDEKKQNEGDDPKSSRDEKDKKSRNEKKKAEQDRESQLNRIEAWVARLPRSQQERISRNDFSGFPARYRRLLREYTRLRAEREARAKPR